MNKKVMIAMSGGVDSSVAALLMQQAGYDCVGATMLLCSDKLTCSPTDPADARSVAQRLAIPFFEYDARELFEKHVVQPFINVYEQGGTPNPCVECNKKLKFGHLLDLAFQAGCSHVVTGHYAKIREENGRFMLRKAPDAQKDQSYFLAGLTQQQLAHVLFPLGELTKEQVRAIAQEHGLINAKKRDSQDICFIPDGDYFEFIRRYTGVSYPEGAFLDLNGQRVGTHKSALAYTLGQRKGLGLAMGAPVYVCAKDMESNTVTVGPEEVLFSTTLIARDLNWMPFDTLTEPIRVTAKARSRHREQPATVYPQEDGVKVVFDEPQRALTPGQAVVFYDGDTVLGSGTITKVL